MVWVQILSREEQIFDSSKGGKDKQRSTKHYTKNLKIVEHEHDKQKNQKRKKKKKAEMKACDREWQTLYVLLL